MGSVVTHSDREWLLIGAAESCATRGYEETTIADICTASGVSRASFEELFADESDCIAAAVESLLEEARRRIEAVHRPGGPWAAVVHDGATTLLGLFAERPAFAHLALVEAPTAGGRAGALCAWARETVLAYLEQGRQHRTGPAEIPASAARGALAGAEALIVGQILAGRAQRLGELASDVAYLLTVPYLGLEEAGRLAAGPAKPSHLRAVA